MAPVSSNPQPSFSKPVQGLAAGRLLLVDDDPALLEALTGALALRLPHVCIETCSTGGSAFQRVKRGHYDVIISDLRMPGVEGLVLLRMLQKISPATPFILMTADSTSEAAMAAQNEGAYRVLSKPLDRDVVTATVKEALENSGPRNRESHRRPPFPAA
jgi:DNA-binding NtrC family response regulator